LFAFVLFSGLASCSSRPVSPSKPHIDTDSAAAKALELFDSNSDGALDNEELKRVPGLSEGKKRADADGNGTLSADEIAQRIASWYESPRKLISTELVFTYNKRLVRRAKVTLVPEPFLQEWLSPVTGETSETGAFAPTISQEIPGAYMGYYRVKVSVQSGGKERIPPKFNEQTELGVELCHDRPVVEENFVIPIEMSTRKRR